MKPFEALSRGQRELCIRAGVIRRAAKRSGFTRATMSKTFSGEVKQPNPKAVRALTAVIAEILREEQSQLQSFADLAKVVNL
jgi:hypothetical protein